MGIRTEAWWVCVICNVKVKRMKSKNKNGTLRQKYNEHKKKCKNSTLWMKQVKQ